MQSNRVKVVVTGFSGKMGLEIIKQSLISSKISLHALLCKKKVISKIIKNKEVIDIYDNINSINGKFDVLIDFSSPKACMKYLDFCKNNNINMVIGTTGFHKDDLKLIRSASEFIGIVQSYNFSESMNIIMKIINTFKKLTTNSSIIEIIEKHRNSKKDIPSGTALNILNIINKVLKKSNKKITNLKVFRTKKFFGEHKINFIHQNEIIKIQHRILNRKVFAINAINAAIWIAKKNRGIFSIQDVLDL